MKCTSINIENFILVFEEFLAVLKLISMVDCANLITILLCGGIVANEGALLSTFNLKFDMRALESLLDVDIDHTVDHIAWLIEGELSLQLNLALGEFASFV